MPPLDYTQMTSREVLLVIASKVEGLDDAVNGNGRPGLVERVAALEERSVPSKKERWGVIGAVLAGLFVGVLRLFGMDVSA